MYGSHFSRRAVVGYSEFETLKSERANAITAMRQLLVGESEACRMDFQKRITEAKTSAEISRIMAEVREKL